MEVDSSSKGYRLRNGRIPILLALRRVGDLKPHEETVPEDLERLVQMLGKDPVLRHPIIADAETGVVLDGTHRLAALRQLGCQLAPCALVKYQDRKVVVERWFRIVTGARLNDFRAEVRALGPRVLTPSMAEECLANRRCCAALEDSRLCLAFPSVSPEPVELARGAFEIENIARRKGLRISYSDSGSLEHGAEESFVLSTIRLGKEEVVEASLQGRLFPPKTTRHIIPSRPLGVRAPLPWLKTDLLEEAQPRFLQHLQSRRIRHLPEGSWVGSRRYQEEVFIFE